MIRIITGDCREELAKLPAESVHMCCTSPPYFGLRDYGTATWAGGDPECDHTGSRRGYGTEKQSTSGGTSRDPVSRSCRLCGATRVDNQIGLEESLEAYVETLVAVFREIKRVLRSDGSVFLNLGDAYAGSWGAQGHRETPAVMSRNSIKNHPKRASHTGSIRSEGLKPKDLMMIPARVALALQSEGWWLRRDIIWGKANGMPDGTNDRPGTAHEHVLLLSKSGSTLLWQHRDKRWVDSKPEPDYRWIHKQTGRETKMPQSDDETWRRVNLWRGYDYFYDWEAVKLPAVPESVARLERKMREVLREDGDAPQGSFVVSGGGYAPPGQPPHQGARKTDKQRGHTRRHAGLNDRWDAKPKEDQQADGARLRDVWWLAPAQYADAHFAVMPTTLAACCILAGCPEGGTVLDPFGGAGTTGLVADRLGRNAILIELSPDYAEMARRRIQGDSPLLAEIGE